jgi:hypothetical protein
MVNGLLGGVSKQYIRNIDQELIYSMFSVYIYSAPSVERTMCGYEC